MTESKHNSNSNHNLANNSNDTSTRYAIDKLAEVALKVNTTSKIKLYFRIGLVILIVLFIFWFINRNQPEKLTSDNQEHIALIRINGPIISSDEVIRLLQRAYKNPNAKAIFLLLNSPGGSAVQSAQIYNQIIRLKKTSNKPIYSFISDICTSGCYYLASATDEIYANPASLIGSIGVIIQSFGVSELFKKIGVEARTYTAGKDKDFLSPFSKNNEKQKQHLLTQLNLVHKQFINDVISGRKGRLKTAKVDLFTGLIWAGVSALDLGLIDGFYYYDNFAKDNFKKTTLLEYQTNNKWFQFLFNKFKAQSLSFINQLRLGSLFSVH